MRMMAKMPWFSLLKPCQIGSIAVNSTPSA
jgi:hypothetical protein